MRNALMIVFVSLCLVTAGYAQSPKNSTILMCEVDVRVKQDGGSAVNKGKQKVQIEMKPHESDQTRQLISVKGSHDIWFHIYVPIERISLDENDRESDGQNAYLVIGNHSTTEQFVFFESDRGKLDYMTGKITAPRLKSLSKIEVDRRTGLVEGHVTNYWPSSRHVAFKGYCKPTDPVPLF